MKKALSLLLCAVLALSLMPLSSQGEEMVKVYNWEEYIDPAAIELFTQETGIKVDYMRFTTNEDMLVQVRNDPSAFDVVFPSDYVIERLVKEDLLMELDFTQIPNAEHILDWLKNPAYDPENKYSVPYMWGTVGILYDTTRVNAPIDSWQALFSEDYQGEVFMLDSFRDSMGVALKYLGYSMNTRSPEELKQATDLLIQQKTDGIVKAYQVDETKDKMIAQEGILGVMWSGDAQYAITRNDKLQYVVPKEGSNVWVDGMVVTKETRNPENAMKFINFMNRPDIAQMNCEYIEYSSPNKAAIELMGEEYLNNPTINPPQEVIDNCEFFHDVHDFIAIYNALWAQVKSAK